MLLISSTPTSITTGNSSSGSSGYGSSGGGDSNTPSQRIAKVMNKGNQVIAVYTHDNYRDGSGHGNVQHSWRFEGLNMSFDPRTFEIKVSVKDSVGG